MSEARLSVRIPDELDEKLETTRKSGQYEIPRSEVVRKALEEHLCGESAERKSAKA